MEKVRTQFLSLRHIILKYKLNSCFSMVDPRISSARDSIWKASVILSEIRSRAQLNCACLCFCTLHTGEIPRTAPMVQVDYARVVDLDVGASKSDICAIKVVTISECAGRTRACNRGLVLKQKR
jgi:hypothetical protein